MRGSMRRSGQAWELRVYLGRDPITGKARYRSRTFRGSKRRAEEALARLLTESRSGAEVLSTGQTFGGLVEQWFTSWSGEWSPSTMAEMRRMIDTKLVGLAKVKLERLTPAYLDAFYGELRLRGGTAGGPLAQNTVRRIHAVVSSASEQAVRWGWLDNNPAQRAWKGKGKGVNRPAPNTVPATIEVVRLLDAAWAPGAWNLAALLELEVHTGLRRSELLALRWPSFDVTQGTLSVGSAIVRGSDGLVEKPATKTNSTRGVLLSTDAQEILRGHRERCADRAAAAGVALARDCYIFSTSAGTAYAMGDRVVTLAPGAGGTVVTSDTGTVVFVDPHAPSLSIRMDDDNEIRKLIGPDIGADRLALSYAVTAHRSQGSTVDRALEDGGGRELAYLKMSRAKERSTVYVVGDSIGQKEDLRRE